MTNLIDVTISNEGSEVIDLSYVKAYAQLTTTYQDTLLTTLIKSARKDIENYADISIVTKTIRAEWSEVSEYAILPKPKIGEVATMTTGNETSLILADYTFKGSDKKRVLGNFPDGLVLTYDAGYGTDTPEDLKMAICKKVLMDFEHRTGINIANSQADLLPNSWEKTAINYRPTWKVF